MVARYTDFSNRKPLEECSFGLPKTLNGSFLLDTIFDTNRLSEPKNEWIYTYEEVSHFKNFIIKNRYTSVNSKYSTFKGFINRLKKERNEKM